MTDSNQQCAYWSGKATLATSGVISYLTSIPCEPQAQLATNGTSLQILSLGLYPCTERLLSPDLLIRSSAINISTSTQN